jgi:hypothetical protein
MTGGSGAQRDNPKKYVKAREYLKSLIMTTLFFKCRPRANNLSIQSYKTSFTLQLFSTDASNPIVPVRPSGVR